MLAFEELVRRHQRGLFSYLYRMYGKGTGAEELAQAAMVRACLRSTRT
jgi:DNA-directed RNA polymerase specialized sigma24 family protein